MASLGPTGLARRLRSLDRATFVEFVAAVWSASGWSTAVDGPVVTARRGEDVRRLFVLPPRRLPDRWRSVEPPDGVVDVVVTPRTTTRRPVLPRGTPDAVVVGASDLRERLFHAVPGGERRQIAESFLDVDPADVEPGTESPGGWVGPFDGPDVPIAVPLPSAVRSRRSRLAAGVLLVGVLAIGFLVAGPVLGGSLAGGGLLGPDRSPEDPRGIARSTQITSGEPAEPTCDREPRAVVEAILTTVVKVDDADGPRTLWEFSDPAVRENTEYDTFQNVHDSISFDLLWNAEAVEVERVRRTGGNATAIVAVEGPNGPGTYGFDLVRTEVDGQADCWRVADLRGP